MFSDRDMRLTTAGTTLNYFLDQGLNRAVLMFPGLAAITFAILFGILAHFKSEHDTASHCSETGASPSDRVAVVSLRTAMECTLQSSARDACASKTHSITFPESVEENTLDALKVLEEGGSPGMSVCRAESDGKYKISIVVPGKSTRCDSNRIQMVKNLI